MSFDNTVAKPELLIPAGSLEVLKTAVTYGADAIYIGGDVFSLRAKARNFTEEEMIEGIEFAHSHGVKIHVTANILAHNDDIDEAREYFRRMKDIKPDALIISDPGMMTLAKEECPEIEIHVSTQANNTNYMSFKFWHDLGAKRVVTARELSLAEIKDIRSKIPDDLEIESFIHGAMCISYSGRCLLSNYMVGRDANQGACTHPCRWKYAVVEEKRPGVYMPVYENERGTYIFNSGDLCMIEYIPEMIDAGINSFKIEGRMKTALYVATVARTYRKAIDDLFESEEKYRANMDWYREQISNCTYRQFTTAFYFGKPGTESQIYDSNTYVRESVYLGSIEEIREDGAVRLTQKNKFCVGDDIEIMKPDGRDITVSVTHIEDEKGVAQESCPHSKQIIYVKLQMPDGSDIKDVVSIYDILRVKSAEEGK